MSLPLGVAALVLLAALFHATWNAAVKVGGDRLVVMTLYNIVGLIVGWSAIPFLGLPEPGAWPYLIASSIFHTGYYLVLIRAYQHGDLSHVYPLARGMSPLLVAIGAAVLAGEHLSALGVVGVTVGCAGITSLVLERGLPWRQDPRAVLYALTTSLFIGAYTLADGVGVRESGHALTYIAWLVALDGMPLVVIAMVRRRGRLGPALLANWRNGLLAGVISIAAYGLVIWAMSQGPMASVSAIRETSVIFAAIIGAVLLKERFGKVRIVATMLVVTGVVTLQLSG